MQINLKDKSVNLSGLNFKMLQALANACQIWKQHGVETLTITSACDGKHVPHSKHYTGNAIDIRKRGLPDDLSMCDQLRTSLCSAYDVILEIDHIHIEYDPDL